MISRLLVQVTDSCKDPSYVISCFTFLFFLFFYKNKNVSHIVKGQQSNLLIIYTEYIHMAKGLSHLVFIASTEESYHHTIDFYKAFGFKAISVSNGEKQNEIWLKLDSNEHAMTSDIVIKLILSVGSAPRPRPDNESDWSLNPSAIALSVMDVSVSL